MSWAVRRGRGCFLGTLALGALLAGGCDVEDGTGVPLPDPLPLVSAMRATGAPEGEVREHRVIGLPGAVASAGLVQLTGSQGTFDAEATASGSFYAMIQAAGGEAITVRYRASEPVTLTLAPLAVCPPPMGCAGAPPPEAIDGTPPVEASGDGEVTIRGTLAIEGTVLAVNVDSGAAATVATDPSGVFALKLSGRSGDALEIYADRAPLGTAWKLAVP